MRRRWLGLGIGVTALLAFPATSIGRTLDVFPGDSIQHAVHKAHSGDVIRVHQGTYRGSVEITKNGLTLKGSGIDRRKGSLIKPGHTKRCGNGAAGICIVPHKKGSRKARTKDTVIEGFQVRGFKDFGGIAEGARRTTFDHNKFVANGEYGVAAFGSIRTKFLHNLSAGGGEAGFYVGDSPRSRAILRGNRARDNGQFGFFLRDSSHGRALRNEAVHNCLGIGLLNTGAPGGVLNWRIRDNEANSNNHFCKAEEGGPPVSGTGIGVLGAKKSVVKHNSVLSNRPSQPGAPFAGGIVVASTKPLGGSVASKNRILANHALKNKPADIVWDGQGTGNQFRKNRCGTSVPNGLCQ
jgi:parallel beta-helix repeat protein